MDVLKKFKGLSESPAPDGQDAKKDSGTKSKLLSTWYNMKYGKAMFSLESNNTITMQSPVWLLGQCYHRKMRQRIHVADQVKQACRVMTDMPLVILSFGFYRIFNFVNFVQFLVFIQFSVLSNFVQFSILFVQFQFYPIFNLSNFQYPSIFNSVQFF